MKKILILFGLMLVLISGTAAIELHLKYDKFYTVAEVAGILEQFAKKYPDKFKFEVIGKSYEDRDIWAVTLFNPKTGPIHEKPAYLIQGNIHGNEIQGTEVCLYIMDYLLSGYGQDPFVTQLVDSKVFLLIPIVNVDGRFHFLKDPNDPDTFRQSTNPVDEDHDGLFDEDGLDDLDKDGNICQMRKKDRDGKWKLDPKDPRIMVRIEPGERGEYDQLELEGIDNDGDGQINEDGPGGYDLNRTYAFNWQPAYVEGGTSDYPLAPENTFAITEFIKKHPNILFFQDFHNNGGMILRGPGAKNMGEFSVTDKRIYDYLGKEGEKILPGYHYLIIWKDLYTVYGGSDDQLHQLFGAFGYANELYADDQDLNKDGKVDDQEMMKWNDLVLMGRGFVNWHPYHHSKYGDIEIGGWIKFLTRIPPSFQLQELCHRNAAFILFTASHLPDIEIKDAGIEKLGTDVFRVRVALTNRKIVPTRTYSAVKNNIGSPDYLEVSGRGLNVITGGEVGDKYERECTAQKHHPEKLVVNQLEGLSTRYFEWLVQGGTELTVSFISQKAGRSSQKFNLR